jgi:DNA polymerase bacteriophage-type
LAVAKVRITGPLTNDAINTLTRSCLTAPPGFALAVCDFSQVEARGLQWAAGDHEGLKVFHLFDSGDKVNGDPYRAMAAKIYGRTPAEIGKESIERKVGKAAELALGYGQGAGGECHPSTGKPFGFYGFSTAMGADWNALAPLTPKSVVDKWRQVHEPITAYWKELEQAATSAVNGVDCASGPFEYLNCDGLVVCRLPSGRPLVYRGMKISRDERGRPGLSYMSRESARRGIPERTYGGKLAENCIQAMCRDLMAVALVKAEAEGLAPCLTIHDEIICQVPASEAKAALALLHSIMCETPPWAAGMPIAAAGHVCERYHK